MITKHQGVSIFFPCYNDSKTIKILVKNAFLTIRKFTSKYEVIVIDDGSTDSSRKILLNMAKKYKKLKLVFHKKNEGYGGALKSGFKKAKYELVFYTDGDGQYDIRELPYLLYLMNPKVDFINGIKIGRRDPSYRIVIGNIYSFLVRWLFWVPIIDIDCDFRLIRKSILNQIHLNKNSGAICMEIVKRSHLAGAKFRQVSVRHHGRKFGKSQFFRVEKILQTLYEIFTLWLELILYRQISLLLKKIKLQIHLPVTYNPIHASSKQAN